MRRKGNGTVLVGKELENYLLHNLRVPSIHGHGQRHGAEQLMQPVHSFMQCCPAESRSQACESRSFPSFDSKLSIYIQQLIQIYSLEMTRCKYRKKHIFTLIIILNTQIFPYLFFTVTVLLKIGKIKMHHCYH